MSICRLPSILNLDLIFAENTQKVNENEV